MEFMEDNKVLSYIESVLANMPEEWYNSFTVNCVVGK